MSEAAMETTPANECPPSQAFQLWFDHGLGDCVQMAHVLDLYRRRGYDIQVHYEPNKQAVFETAGFPGCVRPAADRYRYLIFAHS